jgi:hypothetical protein
VHGLLSVSVEDPYTRVTGCLGMFVHWLLDVFIEDFCARVTGCLDLGCLCTGLLAVLTEDLCSTFT